MNTCSFGFCMYVWPAIVIYINTIKILKWDDTYIFWTKNIMNTFYFLLVIHLQEHFKGCLVCQRTKDFIFSSALLLAMKINSYHVISSLFKIHKGILHMFSDHR